MGRDARGARRWLRGSACTLAWVLLSSSAPPAANAHEVSGPGWLHELRLGILAHDVGGLWSGTRREGGVDLAAEAVLARPALRLRLGTLRPSLGVSLNTRGDTSQLHAGWLWQIETRSGWLLSLGLGASLHDGKLSTRREDRKSLGTRVLFRIPIEVGYAFGERHRLWLSFDHVSNASLSDANEGLDTLGIRYGIRF